MLKAYYDRRDGSIDGLFTVMRDEEKLFERLPARSGQRGFTETSWVRGKSPIPYGRHRLSLKSMNPGSWAGATGIGEFFPIFSPDSATRREIVHPLDHTKMRLDIGLHPENSLKGSAGCIVLLNDTPERKAEVARLFKFLREYGESKAARFFGEKSLSLEVL